MMITRVRAPVYRTRFPPYKERFKTTDILAKEDVNMKQHAHNLKERRKEVWTEYKAKFERNFNFRIQKHVNIAREIQKEIQTEAIKEKQQESLEARLIRRLNIL